MAARRMGMIGFLFCLCLYLMPCSAQAVSISDATEPISTESVCSLTLFYTCDGTACSDVPGQLYQIADVSAAAQYTLMAPFLASGLVLNGIQSVGEWDVIRSTLEAYMIANAIEPDFTAVTDQAGQIHWGSLKPGLYLATAEGAEHHDLQCFFEPALIALPGLDTDGQWQYSITVTPKPGVLPPITPDDKDEPSGEDDVQYRVLKLWKDETDRTERPQSIEVEIFRNGKSYQTVTLSEENHWSYAWMEKNDGADWIVAERNVPAGYSVTVEESAATFILTNIRRPDDTPPETPPSDEDFPKDDPSTDGPKTGDTPHILLYTVLMYVSGIVLILLGITGKKKHV